MHHHIPQTLRKDEIDIYQPKASYSNFKQNCLPKKELSSRMINYSTSNCPQPNLTHNNGDKRYHYNYPLKSNNKNLIEIKQYARLTDFMNTKATQQEALKPKASIKPKAKHNTRNENITEIKKGNHTNSSNNSNNHNHYTHISAHPRENTLNTEAPFEYYAYPNNTIEANENKRKVKSAFCSQETSFQQDEPLDYKDIVKEMINITKAYTQSNNLFERITSNNIISVYKKTIKHMKHKDELINKMLKVYVNKTGNDAFKEDNNVIALWRWFKDITNDNCNDKNGEGSGNSKQKNGKTNEYELLCEKLMEEYNIRDIDHLASIMERALKKEHKSNSFFEGIKKILLPNNMPSYSNDY